MDRARTTDNIGSSLLWSRHCGPSWRLYHACILGGDACSGNGGGGETKCAGHRIYQQVPEKKTGEKSKKGKNKKGYNKNETKGYNVWTCHNVSSISCILRIVKERSSGLRQCPWQGVQTVRWARLGCFIAPKENCAVVPISFHGGSVDGRLKKKENYIPVPRYLRHQRQPTYLDAKTNATALLLSRLV